MATIAERFAGRPAGPDVLSGTPRAHAIDRWIFVFIAAWFIAIVLTGFIPDSLEKIAAVKTGERPPLPLAMHMHAVLMASFLLLLLVQTWLMATGRRGLHMRLGILGMVLVPALVIAGFVLVPTTYHAVSNTLPTAPPAAREDLWETLQIFDNFLLVQLRAGILFSLFLTIGLVVRSARAGLHKRMMILATAMPLSAGIDRISWLPSTVPESPVSADLYTLLAVSPMFVWDIVRNRGVHRAYWIWLGINLPFAVAVHGLWDTPWWHAIARQIMGVG